MKMMYSATVTLAALVVALSVLSANAQTYTNPCNNNTCASQGDTASICNAGQTCSYGDAASLATSQTLDIFGQTVWFANGATLPAGTYTLKYLDGCIKYNSGT